MDNLAIARVFAEIGDLLEIKNENPFKIRAYRNAAETIAHHPDQIAAGNEIFSPRQEDYDHAELILEA